jgi:putative FmdB family regulatory protein
MPVYTYRCSNCGVEFDHQQKFAEKNLSRCPECGKKKLNRVYRPVGVVFKGSGFYVTDNRSKSSASLLSTSKEKDQESSTSKEKTEPKKKENATEKSKSETVKPDKD